MFKVAGSEVQNALMTFELQVVDVGQEVLAKVRSMIMRLLETVNRMIGDSNRHEEEERRGTVREGEPSGLLVAKRPDGSPSSDSSTFFFVRVFLIIRNSEIL